LVQGISQQSCDKAFKNQKGPAAAGKSGNYEINFDLNSRFQEWPC
jgi:hypothetical protein